MICAKSPQKCRLLDKPAVFQLFGTMGMQSFILQVYPVCFLKQKITPVLTQVKPAPATDFQGQTKMVITTVVARIFKTEPF